MDFDRVDVNNFGHALNDDVLRPVLLQTKGNLESATARAQKDLQYRQVVLRQEGRVNLETDAEWQRLRAKASRLENLEYAIGQKIIMDAAKEQSGLQDGPIVYKVTEADCRLKKAAYDAAHADLAVAKENAREFGPDLAAVVEHVDHLAQKVVTAKCQFQLAMSQLCFNKKRAGLVAAYDGMLATARKVCAAATEGERLCLGLNLKFDTDGFKAVAEAYNDARQKMIAAKSALASVSIMATASVDSAPDGSSSSTSASTSSSTSASALANYSALAIRSMPSSNNRPGTSADCDQQLEPRPYFRSSGHGRADYRQSSSSARREFEALLATVYGCSAGQQASPAPPQARATVAELFEAVRLTQITISWESTFAPARAQWQLVSLAECMENGDDDGREECIVLHLALVRPEVSAVHVRLLLAYLGYPAVVMVKRGYATRRGPREDFAWVRFRTLAEAVDCKWRWDGKGHWGLTPWDEAFDQPRPLHFSFSTDPRYAGLQA